MNGHLDRTSFHLLYCLIISGGVADGVSLSVAQANQFWGHPEELATIYRSTLGNNTHVSATLVLLDQINWNWSLNFNHNPPHKNSDIVSIRFRLLPLLPHLDRRRRAVRTGSAPTGSYGLLLLLTGRRRRAYLRMSKWKLSCFDMACLYVGHNKLRFVARLYLISKFCGRHPVMLWIASQKRWRRKLRSSSSTNKAPWGVRRQPQ